MANLIFDFDGTIADSFEYVFAFLSKEAGKTKAFSTEHAVEYRLMSMKDIAVKLGIPFWRLPATYFRGRRAMRAHVLHIAPFPEMPAVIRDVAAAGHTLSIVSSNSAKNVRAFLRQHNLSDEFEQVIGGAGIFGKRRPIRRLARRHATEPTWYIGDEVTDVLSAKAAGVHSLAVAWGFASLEGLEHTQPDKLVTQPAQILDVFQK